MNKWKYTKIKDLKWKNPLKDRGARIDEKMKEGHFRLFGHIQWRVIN